MKSFKVILTAVALGVAASSPLAFAQQKGKGGPSPAQQIERIEEAVGSLTKEQKDKITAIIEKTRADMQKLPQEERKQQMGDVMRKQREAIAKVLTPEQQEKFRAAGRKGGGRKKN